MNELPELKVTQVNTPLGDETLLSAEELAVLFGVSCRHVAKMRSERRLPVAVRLRAVVRWRVGDLRDWIRAGCPQRPR